jgi:hypothetical protein
MVLILQTVIFIAAQAMALSLAMVLTYMGILIGEEIVLYINKNRPVLYIPVILFIHVVAFVGGAYVNRLSRRWAERPESVPKIRYIPRHSIYTMRGTRELTAA